MWNLLHIVLQMFLLNKVKATKWQPYNRYLKRLIAVILKI